MRANAELRVDRAPLSHHIAELELGRPLIRGEAGDPGENVFHRDGLKHDYQSENLVVKWEGTAAKQLMVRDAIVADLLKSFDRAMGRGTQRDRGEEGDDARPSKRAVSASGSDDDDDSGGGHDDVAFRHCGIAFLCDRQDKPLIRSRTITLDRNEGMVPIKIINGQLKPFIRSRPD